MRKALYLMLAALLFSGFHAVHAQEEDFAKRFERILEHYMNTKDGLVHNRTDLATAWAERLETSFSTTPDHIFPEDELPLWLEMRSGLVQKTGKIVDAGSLGAQREALAELSRGMKDFVEQFGNPGGKIYVMQCLQYSEDGALWLSRTSRVANPYYGPERMDCGEVIAEL